MSDEVEIQPDDDVDALMVLAASASRLALARVFGQATGYGGQRDYYEVLGYPETLGFSDYETRYQRQDIAARVIELPAQDTWKLPPTITEQGSDGTPFVTAWQSLANRLRVWSMLQQADRLAGIGQYGVLLFGVRSETAMELPVEQNSIGGERGLLYLRVFSEGAAEILTWNEDAQSERYGLPLTYRLDLGQSQRVAHWTRILHIAENADDVGVYGKPRLQRVYNRLDDLLKVVGGSAEATWLNMRPGTFITNRPDSVLPQDTASRNERLDWYRRYAHDVLRILEMENADVKQVGASEIADPRGIFDTIIGLIAAASGIPQRVLLGSAAGELAAAKEDTRQWYNQIASRQKNYAEPRILRPFIERLQWMGALPATPAGYEVGQMDEQSQQYRWPSLFEMDELEQAQLTAQLAAAARQLADPTGQLPITTPEARQLLGYEPLPQPTVQSLAANAGPGVALAMAITNYRQGDITADQLAEFAIAEWAEAMGDE